MNTYDLVTRSDSERFPREYVKPTPVRITQNGAHVGFAVFGTNYGYLHTVQGNMRLWKTYSGAHKAAKRYVGF